MARYFNGAYSVRAGYHGARKNNSHIVMADYWVCSNGHTNQDRVLIKGEFPHYEKALKCQTCGEIRGETQ